MKVVETGRGKVLILAVRAGKYLQDLVFLQPEGDYMWTQITYPEYREIVGEAHNVLTSGAHVGNVLRSLADYIERRG